MWPTYLSYFLWDTYGVGHFFGVPQVPAQSVCRETADAIALAAYNRALKLSMPGILPWLYFSPHKSLDQPYLVRFSSVTRPRAVLKRLMKPSKSGMNSWKNRLWDLCTSA